MAGKAHNILLILVLCSVVLSCGDTLILEGDNPGVIITIAGGGERVARAGDPALKVTIVQPKQIEVGDFGDLYIIEYGFHRLLYVDTQGKVQIIAGSTTPGFAGDGGPAGEALLSSPSGITVDQAGNIYIADMINHRIRKIDTSGIISTVAGSAISGFGGDGGPATQASLFRPVDVAVGPMGRIYISDNGNNRIRMVDLDGTIQTICGTGEFSYNGTGIPADIANIYKPVGLFADDQGNLYIAVSGHHRIRKIDFLGEITTIAGTGVPGFSGDGDLATSASLYFPQDVFMLDDGSFYIADQDNQRVRFVDRSGIISTIAGNGEKGYNGDGLFATDASLDSPTGVTMDAYGYLYIADTENFRIRRVPFPETGGGESGGTAPRNPLGPISK